VLEYVHDHDIRMYRISSDVAPYVTHPDMPQFHGQVEECREQLADLGRLARDYDIRLSFHPSQYVVLNSPDEKVARQSIQDFVSHGEILDAMGQGPEAVIITHVGGVYGDKENSIRRFMERYTQLPDVARRRLVVENDEESYSVLDILRISREVGIPVVMDYLHHMNYNPEHMGIREMLSQSLDTWPVGVTPKIHFSSPRTELRELKRKNPATGKMEISYQPPLLSQHSDYINPFEFTMFMQQLGGLPDFDIMLEAKAKDLALLRLREQLHGMGMPADEHIEQKPVGVAELSRS
jgi:UV DNA damage endonuclease